MEEVCIGVKYCGGCRAQYDRKDAVAKISEGVQGAPRFVPAKPGVSYDALLVVCGCHTCCADISGFRADGKIVKVDSESGWLSAREELNEILFREKREKG